MQLLKPPLCVSETIRQKIKNIFLLDMKATVNRLKNNRLKAILYMKAVVFFNFLKKSFNYVRISLNLLSKHVAG